MSLFVSVCLFVLCVLFLACFFIFGSVIGGVVLFAVFDVLLLFLCLFCAYFRFVYSAPCPVCILFFFGLLSCVFVLPIC